MGPSEQLTQPNGVALHLTSPHITSPHITSHHLTLPHITPRCAAVCTHITSRRWSSAPDTQATCAKLHCSSFALGESGYTSVVVAYVALVTPAQRPIDLGDGMAITPSCTMSSS